jgi:hypothetical protein
MSASRFLLDATTIPAILPTPMAVYTLLFRECPAAKLTKKNSFGFFIG